MEILEKTIRASVGTIYELSELEQRLMRDVLRVRKNAQAPYSQYAAGAVALGPGGRYGEGCNVERCTWTQTSHAEQSAIDDLVKQWGPTKVELVLLAGAAGYREIVPAHAVTDDAFSNMAEVPVPCGHCLQIIWENCYNNPNVRIITLAGNGLVYTTTIGDAFPMRFGPKDLGVDYSAK